jgi:hypothetical protein
MPQDTRDHRLLGDDSNEPQCAPATPGTRGHLPKYAVHRIFGGLGRNPLYASIQDMPDAASKVLRTLLTYGIPWMPVHVITCGRSSVQMLHALG